MKIENFNTTKQKLVRLRFTPCPALIVIHMTVASVFNWVRITSKCTNMTVALKFKLKSCSICQRWQCQNISEWKSCEKKYYTTWQSKGTELGWGENEFENWLIINRHIFQFKWYRCQKQCAFDYLNISPYHQQRMSW